MSKRIAWLLLGLLAVIGCKSDDDSSEIPSQSWVATFVTANATHPVISSDNSSFLFLREGQGLYVWRGGVETLVSHSGSSVRPDYSWSLSGENAFAYSVPGEPSASSGIFIVDSNGVATQVWDRGSSPSYFAAENYLLCAGPPESEYESGIWKIHLPSLERDRFSPEGISPSLSNNGQVFSYLVPQTTSSGSVLVSRRTSDLEQLMTISHVSQFKGSFLSETILAEVIANLESLPIPPAIYRTATSDPPPFDLIAQPATYMDLLEDGGILFNRLNGDILGSLMYKDGDEEQTISDSLFSASATVKHIIYAVGHSGISRLTLQ